MKTLLRIVSILALAAGAARSAPATATDSEFYLQREGGNGFVLVDRATGVMRTASLNAAGEIVWEHNVATGIADATDVAGGVPGKSGELAAVASPMANRVALVEIDAAYPSMTRFAQRGIGPGALSELDTSAGTGLLIGCSLFGSGVDDGLEIWSGFGGTPSQLQDDRGFGPVPVLEPLYNTTSGPRVAVFARRSGTDTEMGICVEDATILHPKRTIDGQGWRFVTNVHTVEGDLAVLFWEPGADVGLLTRASLPVGASMSFSAPAKVSLPFDVRSVFPVAPDLVMSDGILATSADGSHLSWLRIHSDGSVDEQEVFDADPDADFLGAVQIPGKGVVRFEGDLSDGVSAAAKVWRKGTHGWEITDESEVPPTTLALARRATLFHFSQDPFLDEEARLLAIEPIEDWTRKSDPLNPMPPTVYREEFVSPLLGLANPSSVPTHPLDGTNFVMTNQVDGALSLAALEGGAAVFQPEFGIRPPSGSYSSTVTVVPSFNAERYTLYYRSADPLASWERWPGNLMVAASGEFLFTLVDSTTSPDETSRFIRRAYQIDPAGMNRADADHDGVPDYVEQAHGLDPAGGADSDGDGASDLEELFAGTDPARSSSHPADPRTPVPQGDGIELVALPFGIGGDGAADAVQVIACDGAGGHVGGAPVADIPPGDLPGINRGAWISSSVSVPESEWLALSTASFFQIDAGGSPADGGLEIRKFITVPLQPALEVNFTPSGTDLAADAAGWLAAAQTAFASYVPVTGRTDMVPEDTAAAVLAEAMLHAAATDADLFDPPLALGDFTAFPDRVQDAVRTPISHSLINSLAAAGMDFHALLALVDAGVNGAGNGSAAIRSTVSGIYNWHLTHFDADRSLLLPLDVLRIVFAGGDLPDNYAGAVDASTLATAKTAAAEIVAGWENAMRPMDTWTVEIPETSSGPGVYPRISDSQLVELFDRHGERFLLEQDRSLTPGSQFSVTGFTDAATDSGRPGMEVTAVSATLLPASSSRDHDGNLLDDEWELFFFGATGQDPESIPPGSSATLLQHFMGGTDPRSNGADEPSVPPLVMSRVSIAPTASGTGYDLGFTFPSEYLDRFAFIVEASDTMAPGSFHEVPGTTVVESPAGSGTARITVNADFATSPKKFYRVRLALP